LSRAIDSKNKLRETPRVVVDFDLLRRIGGRNFRDLGGHPVDGGCRVQRGKIYRSAHLAQIPQEEPHPLAAIRLRTLVTLQSQLEVRHLGPPRAEFLDSGVRWEHIPIGDTWFREDGFHKIDTQPGNEHLVILTEFRNDWQMFFKLLAERWHPILDRLPGMDGGYCAVGFSGHGFKMSPVVGQLMAELIVDGKAAAMEIAPLRFARFDENDPVKTGYAYGVMG